MVTEIQKHIVQPTVYPPISCSSLFKSRLKNDLLATPFFLIWGITVALAIQYSPSENFNAFFAGVLEEGVALKSMLVLLTLSVLSLAILFIVQPEPRSRGFRMLQAPWRTGRALCLSMGSMMLGMAGVALFTEETQTVQVLLVSVLAPIWFAWFALFAIDMVAADSKNLSQGAERTWRIFGIFFLICALVVTVSLYRQIDSGHFSSPPHESASPVN
ncbi:hypothetical protein [uncultured Pseudomonas sp.]|uniref:hypothetical protein n=1 Tax=uncultured Pseudomonas sp. TaxID=114707 RepID=UPI0025F8CC7F|nr:hypothetical protein [uncultured Pseudomonas sp.]